MVRVSSAAITSTDRRMSRARCEMSWRQPIGVLTRCLSLTDAENTYRTPFRQKEGEEEANRWERRTPCSTPCNRYLSLATNMGQKKTTTLKESTAFCQDRSTVHTMRIR